MQLQRFAPTWWTNIYYLLTILNLSHKAKEKCGRKPNRSESAFKLNKLPTCDIFRQPHPCETAIHICMYHMIYVTCCKMNGWQNGSLLLYSIQPALPIRMFAIKFGKSIDCTHRHIVEFPVHLGDRNGAVQRAVGLQRFAQRIVRFQAGDCGLGGSRQYWEMKSTNQYCSGGGYEWQTTYPAPPFRLTAGRSERRASPLTPRTSTCRWHGTRRSAAPDVCRLSAPPVQETTRSWDVNTAGTWCYVTVLQNSIKVYEFKKLYLQIKCKRQ